MHTDGENFLCLSAFICVPTTFIYLRASNPELRNMKVTRIKIDNFKSLVDFELKLSKFACLVGLNGSGKSTVLQCFDFLAQQCKGDIQAWLDIRHWSAADLNSRLSHKSNIDFTVDLKDNAGQKMGWSCSFNRKELRCTRESIAVNGRQVLKVEDGYFSVSVEGIPSSQKHIDFFYQGSILSQLEEAHLPRHLLEFKHFFCMFMHWIFFPRSCSGSGPELPKAGWGLREKVFLLFCMKSGSRNKPRSSIS